MKSFWRIGLSLLLLLLLAPTEAATAVSGVSPWQQDDVPLTTEEIRALAQARLDDMTVSERVGQLFMVTFEGDTAPNNSDIADLIVTYHVGGVVLKAENDNVTGYGELANTPFQIAELTNDLQRLSLTGASNLLADEFADPTVGEVTPPPTPSPPRETAVPLLIAVNHEGSGNNQILNRLTEIPSNMAQGATWNPDFARQIGHIVGQELSALGVNMLLGPALDVLENPEPLSTNALGIRSFGGDPYWVSQMGSAYTTGVHTGSQNRMAVISKHFPGYGSSDRPLHEEVPTVRKSLEQLQQIELVPFFAVTGRAATPSAVTDGLLTTHIRYQGFQGNIRATTNPVSFDAQALTALMALEQFAGWRQAGGITMSDALGVNAVERFYDNTEQDFPHRLVAKDAFLAGNDLLYLSDFALGEAPYEAQLANIIDTIIWFQERYQTDVAFQQQVDAAVLRILQLKIRLYGNDFSLENVLVDASNEAIASVVNRSQATVFDVAQNAITLISPSPEELLERMARPPSPDDNIVIFTDIRPVNQCSFCEPQPLISQTALQEKILARYGPEASGQVESAQIQSFSFADLQAFLNAETPIIYNTVPLTPTVAPEATPTLENDPTPTALPTATPPPEYLVQTSLEEVDWIIFAMLDQRGPASQALNNFLAQRPDLVRDNRVVVFAYNAPYFLDTTEITQLTAYYGVYSNTESFIDASVRALFQEVPLSGAAPIDVNSISYNILQQTQPSPNQVIALFVENQSNPETAVAEEPLSVSVGDTLRLQTGVIMDHNGNPVPDGTIVRFIQRERVAGLVNIIAEVPTRNGIAQLDYVLEASTEGGQLRIRVEAGEAVVSQEVDISVESSTDGGEAQITIINPTPAPTQTPEPTITATATVTVTPTGTPKPTANTQDTTTDPPEEPAVQIDLSEFWMLTAMFTGLFLTSSLATTVSQRLGANPEQQIGRPLWGIVGGLILYLYFALNLPGAEMIAAWGSWAGLATTLLGGLVGMLVYQIRR